MGNGDFYLDEANLRAWLGLMRAEYSQMQHWGQSKDGSVYSERIPILIEGGGRERNEKKLLLQSIP